MPLRGEGTQHGMESAAVRISVELLWRGIGERFGGDLAKSISGHTTQELVGIVQSCLEIWNCGTGSGSVDGKRPRGGGADSQCH